MNIRKNSTIQKIWRWKIKKLNETKDKLYNQVINLKETIVKLEGNNANHQSELQIRISENNSLKKVIN